MRILVWSLKHALLKYEIGKFDLMPFFCTLICEKQNAIICHISLGTWANAQSGDYMRFGM